MIEDAVLVRELLDCLLLPSLQALTLDLQVSSLAGFTREDPLHLIQFLRRSCPPLTKLDLRESVFHEANIISYLSLLQTLESLTLHEISPNEGLFHALRMTKGDANDSRSNLCPELTKLIIWNSPARNVSVSAVAKMVLSRSNVREDVPFQCKPLDLLHLHCLGEEEQQALLRYPGLEQCVQAGLNIMFDYLDT